MVGRTNTVTLSRPTTHEEVQGAGANSGPLDPAAEPRKSPGRLSLSSTCAGALT
jgi:hypothetical protein